MPVAAVAETVVTSAASFRTMAWADDVPLNVCVPVKVLLADVLNPAAGVEDAHVVPSEVKTLPSVPGATNKGADVPLPNKTLLAVRVVAPVPPLPTGNVPVTLVVKFANVVEVVPVPPLATGNVPVTLVVRFANVVEVVPVPPLAIGSVPVTCVAKFTPDSVPPSVRSPEDVTVPVKVMPFTVPVPPTDVTPSAVLVAIFTKSEPFHAAKHFSPATMVTPVVGPAPRSTIEPVPALITMYGLL